MEIKYIWIKDYKNIKNQGFNFGRTHDYKYDEVNGLTIEDKKQESINLFSDNISNVTAIIGENGSGKSSIIEALIGSQGTDRLIVTDDNTIYMDSNVPYKFLEENFPVTVHLCSIFNDSEREIITPKIEEFTNVLKSYWEGYKELEDTKNLSQEELDDYLYKYIEQIDFRLNDVDWKLKVINYKKTKGYFESTIYYSTFLNYEFNTNKDVKNLSLTNYLQKDKNFFVKDLEIEIDEGLKFNYDSEIEANYYLSLYRQIDFFTQLADKDETKIPFPKADSVHISFNDFDKLLDMQNVKFFNEVKSKSLVFNLGKFETVTQFIEIIAEAEMCNIILTDEEWWIELENGENITWKNVYLNYLKHKRKLLEEYLQQSKDNLYQGNDFRNQYENIKSFFMYLEKNEGKFKISNNVDNYLEVSIKEAKEFIQEFSKCNFNGNFLNFKWDKNFSSGEKALLNMFACFNTIEPKKDYVILIDEGEAFFHPEWQRKFIKIFLNLVELFFSDNKIQLILTTHSPFIASDLTTDNIIFLSKDDDGNCVVKKDIDYNTFGSNIHTLLTDGFFLENLIGEFAKNKIDDLFKFLEPDKCDKCDKSDKPDLDKDKALQQIKIIGEPIIKNYLLELYYRKFPNTSKSWIAAEIKRLEKLKDKVEKKEIKDDKN